MAAWGDTEGGDARMPPGYGQDGSGGAQPRGNVVAHNLCRELGIWEKQSSCYTQFKASENVVAGNIMFNGPRAHINFNDGMRDCIRIVVAPNTVVNASPPSPVSNYQMVNLKLVDVILEAMARLNPARACAHAG